MKTQIIQLEPHDDYISIRDKMNWSKTPRILLVWPRRRRVKLHALDLKLLQRHAAALGAQLGLVTRARQIRRVAGELGIPVFGTNLAAQREAWPPRQPSLNPTRRGPRFDLRSAREQLRPPVADWRQHPATRLFFFALGVLAVLLVAAAFLPRSSIRLTPVTRTQSVTIPVRADPDVQDVFLSGSVPARQMTLVIEDSRTVAAIGEMAVPDRVARGTAQFRNLTDSPVSIPAGTIIRTSDEPPVRFVTMQDGEVAPGVGETVELPIQALVLGELGNLEADALQAIEGSLGLSLAVTNPEPTGGGEYQTVRAPTADDRERARELLLAMLERRAEEDLTAALDPDDLLFSETITLAEILDERYDPPEGQSGDRLTVTIRAEFSAEYAAAADLRELARAALAASLPEGFVPAPDSLTFEPVGALVTTSAGTTRWQMRVEQVLRPAVGETQIIYLAQGRTPDSARRRLESALSLAAPPQISVSPSWWPWLPVAPFRFDVAIE
ncbi:MAG: hypothetical protein GXP40_11750 [Chloroflexi bacterium]|nr:hypothetical protein [Chloroflexota bacterium]